MTLDKIYSELEEINQALLDDYGLENSDKRVFARLAKLMEELGELSNDILASQGLQREDKLSKFENENTRKEVADVVFCSILLGMVMGVDVKGAMADRIKEIKARREKGNL